MDTAALVDAVAGATTDDAGYGLTTIDVPAAAWADAVLRARTELGCDWFDFLTAVHDPDGLVVVCHLARTDPFGHLLLRTRLEGARPSLASVATVFAGAGWHERETAEMFGITFLGVDGAALELEPLLLPPSFDGHPLRKDFALPARTERPWPGARDPGDA